MRLMERMTHWVRYGWKYDNAADEYWAGRMRRHGMALSSVGDLGLSESGNQQKYDERAEIIQHIWSRLPITTVLDVGCGTGFYMKLLDRYGVTDYTGMDITDELFPLLRHSGYRFLKQDVSVEPIEGKYSLILMLDVIQHIVSQPKLHFALHSVQSALGQNGTLLMTRPSDNRLFHGFHTRQWGKSEVESCLTHKIVESIPFHDSTLLVVQ